MPLSPLFAESRPDMAFSRSFAGAMQVFSAGFNNNTSSSINRNELVVIARRECTVRHILSCEEPSSNRVKRQTYIRMEGLR